MESSREVLGTVEARYQVGSLVLCPQFASDGWHERFDEGAIADADVDRIVHRAQGLHMKETGSMRKGTFQ